MQLNNAGIERRHQSRPTCGAAMCPGSLPLGKLAGAAVAAAAGTADGTAPGKAKDMGPKDGNWGRKDVWLGGSYLSISRQSSFQNLL